jgi:hypothetical protein
MERRDMTGPRLGRIAPDLVERVLRATGDVQREISLDACRHAIAAAGLSDPVVHAGLRCAERGKYGDTAARAAVRDLMGALDETAWGIQEQVDEGGADEATYLTAFTKARAANALFYALDSDPATGALEALYEANVASDDLPQLRMLVTSRSSRPTP